MWCIIKVSINTWGRERLDSNEREIKKYTNFSKKEINEYLGTFKMLISDGCFSIALNKNRQENIEFMEDYNINSEKAKEILLSLDVLDFCYAVDNEKEEFAHEILYVFCKEFDLDNRGDIETVEIYIKSNITKTRGGKDTLIVISFHKKNKEITYLFR